MLVTPTGGAARTISGAATAGLPLISLNGADNVTFDGLNAGGNSLTISNTTVSATAGTSTIRFTGDATNNTLTRCTIQGASTMATTTDGGTIWFSTGTTSGNDNNVIASNNIGPVGANLPTKAIYASGSTTNTTVYNSGVQITGNNIFDFFNAAAESDGIYLASGNTDWTMSNNRFYQTATRTHTTASLHSALQVAGNTGTSNNNHTISGNVIGFSSPTGTGTYSLVGNGVGSKFLAIYFSNAGTTTPSSIQGNTIAGISLSGVVGGVSTTSAFGGIMIASGRANIGTVTGNTVGSLASPGSISVTSNNATSMEAYGIYFFPTLTANISNNTVGGITATNSGAGSLTVYGIRALTTSSVTNTMLANTVGSAAAPISNSSGSSASRVIGLYSANGTSVVTGNTISNLSLNSPNTGSGSLASMIGLWIDNTSATAGNIISQNTIRSLSNSHATAAVSVTGLHYNGATTGTHKVERNRIETISTPSTTSATALVSGISIQAGAASYRNNLVNLGADMTKSPQIIGINETAPDANNIQHNSVFISGAPTTGTASTFAFRSTNLTGTRDYRNNIFFNARGNAGATAKHYAVSVGGAAPNPAGLTMNNNVLLANGTGAVFGFYNALDVASLAAWQTAVGQDAASIASNPLFVSTSDLHLTAGSPARGIGVINLGVARDFDGQGRPGADAFVDIGADEFDGAVPTANDLAAIATGSGFAGQGISFSPQASFVNNGTSAQSSVTVRLRILNAGNTEVYNQTATITSIAGEATATVTFPSTSLAILGTYSVKARAELATDSVPGNDEVTGSLIVSASLAGNYSVGTGGTYTSLTGIGGAFEALNNSGASGNVTLQIISDLTGETGSVVLNALAPGVTLTIRPLGGPRSITGSAAGALIRLNDADNVTIDGSTTGASAPSGVGGLAALRELTITNTSTSTSAAVLVVSGVVNGAQNNTFKNLNLVGADPTTTAYGISLGGVTAGSAGLDNDNNRVENCSVKKAITGIYSSGASAANPNVGTVITRNDLSATGTNRIRRVGIAFFNDDGALVAENSIGGLDSNESNFDAIGIAAGTVSVFHTNTAGGGVINASINRNRINGVNQNITFSAVGIAIGGGAGTNTIANNMITGVIANAISGDIPAGIFVVGATGSTTRLFYNSVAMTGNRGTTASQYPSYGVAITGTSPLVELKNNIFYTTQDPGSGTGFANAKSYAIGVAATTFANLNSDFNTFYCAGPQPGFFRSGSLAVSAGTDYTTLALWRTATGKDANSRNDDPSFLNPLNDLHLSPASTSRDAGTAVAGLTTDFDGDARPAGPASDIGADELGVPEIAVSGNGSNIADGSGTTSVTNDTDFGGTPVT
ncbi:MAG: hypothetical protein K1X78_28830, partial [Verrucomicrobiaceae bacterium]|nr:hypothetical protein [Verrucomicrobiaceae bacterium]